MLHNIFEHHWGIAVRKGGWNVEFQGSIHSVVSALAYSSHPRKHINMDPEDIVPPKADGSAASEPSMTIIKEQDFEEPDFSAQLDPDNDWESEHPIFMTKLPEEMNEGLMALQDIKYGESTPEEVADYCKDRGNEFFKKYVAIVV